MEDPGRGPLRDRSQPAGAGEAHGSPAEPAPHPGGDLYNRAPVGYVTVDRHGVIQRANLTLASMLAVGRGQLLESRFARYVDPDSRETYRLHCLRLFEEEGPRTCELQLRHAEGRLLWARLESVRSEDPEGRRALCRTAITDITEVVESREGLRRQKDRTQRYLDVAEVMILALDREGRIELLNRTGGRILGVAPTEAIGSDWFDRYIPETNRESYRAEFSEVVAGEREIREVGVTPVRTEEGEERLLEWRSVLLTDEDGNATGLLASAADVTEQVRTKRKLEFSRLLLEVASRQSRLQELVETCVSELRELLGCEAAGMRLLAEDGTICWRSFEGFSSQFLQADGTLDLDDGHSTCRTVMRGLADPELPCFTDAGSFFTQSSDRHLEHATDRARQLAPDAWRQFGYQTVALIPFRRGGQIMGLLHLADSREAALQAHEVEALEQALMALGPAIERIRTEQALQAAHDQLERRVRERTGELSEANEALRAEIAERREAENHVLAYRDKLRSLASELALAEERERRRIAAELHEGLGQKLAFARVQLGRLEEGADDGQGERIAEVCKLVEDAMHDVRVLTFDLSPPILYELGLRPAVEWLCERMQREHGLRTDLEETGALPVVSEELGVLLFQSVRELLLNVVHHAETDRARLILEQGDAEVRITVADRGRGFEPLQLEPQRQGGASFGLFNVQERLNHWGGRLELDSEPGRGTRATLIAPAPAENPEAEGSPR